MEYSTKYRVNLDGLALGDTIKCEDGTKIRISGFITRKTDAGAYTLLGVDSRKLILKHYEKDCNCWKFNNPVKNEL